MDDVPLPKLPRKMLECQKSGLHWIAGFIARRYRKIQPNLGAFTKNVTDEHEQCKFTNVINRGGLTIPTKRWYRDLKVMQALFTSFHPKNRLIPGRGVTVKFFNLLVEKFPDYDKKVLKLATKLFTAFRCRTWNALAKIKKAGQKVENMTIPRIKKLSQLTAKEKMARVGKKRLEGKK